MGTLFIVSTPIGNLDDITIRAIKTLFSVDIIACEDTRRTGLLLNQIKQRSDLLKQQFNNVTMQQLLRYDDRTEGQKTPEILDLLKRGKSVALVSDAGTPLINDPGFLLVRECLKRGIKVISVPGASAVLTALTSSGLPIDKFMFLGYFPEKKSHRRKLFNDLLSIHRCISSTYVFFCAPHKLLTTLKELQAVIGDKEVTICRELTKIHEECWKGKISEAIKKFAEAKGEFVLLIFLKR